MEQEQKQKQKSLQRRKVLQNLGLLGGTIVISGCRDSEMIDVYTEDEQKQQLQQIAKEDKTTVPKTSQLPDGLNRDHFIVHNENPLGLESRREIHTSAPITPLQKLFVRNNLPMPS